MMVVKHSFVVMDISPERLNIRALADTGEEIDSFALTKASLKVGVPAKEKKGK